MSLELKPFKIGVVLPSRGLVFSKTMETLIENLKGYDFRLYMAHDLPIPDCFNEPLDRAINDGVDIVWFVEEDMTFDAGTFKEMLKLFGKGNKVITGVYADRRTGHGLVCFNGDKVIYTGMGCLLVDAKEIKKLPKPYVQRASFEMVKTKDGFDYKLVTGVKNDWYGTQDVYFSYMLRSLGNNIATIKSKIGHLQLLERGDTENNKGAHRIVEVFITDDTEVEPFEFIGGNKLNATRVVIPKLDGSCMGIHFVKGETITMPAEVIYAVGQDSFIFVKPNNDKKSTNT